MKNTEILDKVYNDFAINNKNNRKINKIQIISK